MATNLVTPLPEVAFSRNRVIATFQTDSIYASLGVKAVNEFALTGPLFLNRSFEIKYGDLTVNFRVNTLSPQGNNLKSGIGNLAHAQELVAYFQANAYINRDYDISVPTSGPVRIVFTAKAIGNAYNMVPIIYTGVLITNPTAGSDKLKKKNLAIALECQVQRLNSAEFDTVYSERIPYRAAQLSINIGALLHAELAPDLPAAWSNTAPWRHTRSLRKYRLVAAEGYGDSFALQAWETFPEALVHWGGTGFRQGFGKTPAQWVRGATAAADKFLRYGLPVRVLQTDEPQWLSFLNTRSVIANLSVQIRIEYADDSIVTVIRAIDGGLEANKAISIPVWPTALTLHTVDDIKAIRSYYVRLRSGSDFVSEELRYVLDYANREHKQYFVFLNSVGGWDSFLAYGKSSYGVQWTNLQVQRPIPLNYTANDGDLSDVTGTMRDTFVVATSYYTAEQLRYLRDFLNSPYKYRFINGTCYPISIKAKDLAEGSDGQNQYGHEFEYQFAYQNQSYD